MKRRDADEASAHAVASTGYMPGAAPYFHHGGRTGCLVLHGFTASPAEVRWLAEHLAGEGHTVYAPRLPGHGTSPRDLARTRWRDWYAAALDGVHILRSQCDRVVVAGHSMGGLLALLLASDGQVAGAAVLAAPMRFPKRIVRFARWLKYVIPYTDQSDRTEFPQILLAEQARRGEPTIGRVRYDLWPTAAVAELYDLSITAAGRLGRITVPLLIVYSRGDRTAPPDNADIIVRGVRSEIVEQHTLDDCGHIMTQDVERERVFSLVAEFARRYG